MAYKSFKTIPDLSSFVNYADYIRQCPDVNTAVSSATFHRYKKRSKEAGKIIQDPLHLQKKNAKIEFDIREQQRRPTELVYKKDVVSPDIKTLDPILINDKGKLTDDNRNILADRALQVISRVMSSQWQAAAWFLERTLPGQFAKQERTSGALTNAIGIKLVITDNPLQEGNANHLSIDKRVNVSQLSIDNGDVSCDVPLQKEVDGKVVYKSETAYDLVDEERSEGQDLV